MPPGSHLSPRAPWRRPHVAVPLLLLGLLGPLPSCGGEVGDPRFRSVQAGDPAPPYAAVTLGGDTISLESLRGQAVLLNIWATWCLPCREEMPALEALHQRYGTEGLRVVGVSVDGRFSAGEIPGFLESVGASFLILHDPAEQVVRRFSAVGVPESYLIDGEGVFRHRWVGLFDPFTPENLARVEGVLASLH